MTTHAEVRSRLAPSGVIVHEGYCSCGHLTDARSSRVRAARELVEHLIECPDEELADISPDVEAWVEAHYSDRTCTLDEWRARYG